MAFSPESRWKNRSSKLLSACYCTARTQPKNNHYFAARPSLDEFQFHFVVAGTISNELLLWYLSIKCQRPIGRHYTLDWAKCWICHTTLLILNKGWDRFLPHPTWGLVFYPIQTTMITLASNFKKFYLKSTCYIRRFFNN